MASPPNFRPEIQGLRTVAAFLVAAYHIWFDRVSGGVDVFFVVSGFLITGSLVRQASRGGGIDVPAYLSRIARRILPAAYVALAAVLVGTVIFVSRAFWREILVEAIASATYTGNWWFALQSVEYLARDTLPSPVLHFWALSIQGQFYLAWPAAILLALAIARRFRKSLPRAVVIVLVVVFCASFAFSVFETSRNQTFTYFSTVARAWEFALGGLLAMGIDRIRIPARARWLLGWIGLGAIVGTGALLDVGGAFPGYAALLPTLGAALVLVAGTGETRGAVALLGSRPMVYLGDVSYAFFLWHWPIFVFALAARGQDSLSLVGGTSVIAGSLVLAILTTRWIEEPARGNRRTGGRRRLSRGEAMTFAAVPIGLICLLFVMDAVTERQSRLGDGSPDYAGAAAFDSPAGFSKTAGLPLKPDPISARQDAPAPYADDCHQDQEGDEVLTCTYGEVGADFRVALVGGSHSTQWQPAFDLLGEQEGWEVVNITKSSCRFDALEGSGSCRRWNANVLTWLAREQPDVVVTTSTLGGPPETVPEGYPQQWAAVEEMGVPVVAIRDNPWFSTEVPECVAENLDEPVRCALDRTDGLARESPVNAIDAPDDVVFVDLTRYFCTDELCPVVAGDVLMYRDKHHLTTDYVETLAPLLHEQLVEDTSGVFPRSG